jgi:hypothetical protein
MSHLSIANKSGLLAAATALSAAGILTAPAPAQAVPVFPLTPPGCTQWGFPGDVLFRQANGWNASFSSDGPTAGGRALAVSQDGSSMSGNVWGAIRGSHMNVSIGWDSGGSGRYTGDVGSDERLTGNTGGVAFSSDQRFVCLNGSPLF